MGASRVAPPVLGPTPVDRLLLGYLAVLALPTALLVEEPGPVLLGCGASAAALLLAARLRGRSPAAAVTHAFLPVPVLAMLVNLIGPLITRVGGPSRDPELARLDRELLAPLVAAWREAAGRPDWLTDAASIAYFAYYAFPIVVAIALWTQRRTAEFDRLVFAVTISLLASYSGYFFAPARGPRVPPELAQAVLGGGLPSGWLRAFLSVAEVNEFDAFPSGHTAISIVCAAEASRCYPRLRPLFAAAAASIVFATVYLSLHYVIDVAAGAALAAVALAAMPLLRELAGLDPASPSRPWRWGARHGS